MAWLRFPRELGCIRRFLDRKAWAVMRPLPLPKPSRRKL